MSDKHKKTSKFLSLVRRHEPERVGITLDETGWVAVDELLDGCRRAGQAIDSGSGDRVIGSSGD